MDRQKSSYDVNMNIEILFNFEKIQKYGENHQAEKTDLLKINVLN